MTKNLLYLWASDYAENSGEGKLARLFTKYLIKNDKYKIKLNQNITYYRYLSPFFGILYCWKYYLKKNRPGDLQTSNNVKIHICRTATYSHQMLTKKHKINYMCKKQKNFVNITNNI